MSIQPHARGECPIHKWIFTILQIDKWRPSQWESFQPHELRWGSFSITQRSLTSLGSSRCQNLKEETRMEMCLRIMRRLESVRRGCRGSTVWNARQTCPTISPPPYHAVFFSICVSGIFLENCACITQPPNWIKHFPAEYPESPLYLSMPRSRGLPVHRLP